MAAVVQAKHLSKIYTAPKKEPGVKGTLKSLFSREKIEIKAVQDVSFEVQAGELVGFLGPNGAGKTTTIKMLTGILLPSAGEVSVLGYQPFERKPELLRQISLVMGNKAQLWWDLPAYDGFVVLRELYDISEKQFKERLDRLADALSIQDKLQTQLRRMSLGERMKCELIASLLHAPRVIFLDEPTLGLDLVSQKKIRDFLGELNREEGCTMILTSHYMQDVQELCDRVIIIDHGTLMFDGQLDELLSRHAETRRIRLVFGAPVDAADLARYGQVVETEELTHVLEVPRGETAKVTSAILSSMPVNDLSIEEVPIEDVIRKVFARE